MKISKPRRELYKQTMRNLMLVNPRANNIVMANKLGIHRNTVSKLLEEIKNENEVVTRERWKKLLNDVTEIAQLRNDELNKLWAHSYNSQYYSRPSQLVTIVKANWMILKDLYRMHLEYQGVQNGLNTLIQVNVNR